MSEHPSVFVDDGSLEEAHRQLAMLADVHQAEEGDVPAWVIAAKHAVRSELRRATHD